jgi:subtilisin family serine protease
MHRILVLLIAGTVAAVLLLSGNLALAAPLAPELRQRMETAGPGGKVPIIIHFADRLDMQPFARRAHGRDRATARAEMVRGLRDHARRSQGPLQNFLRQQGREPSELWLINALAAQVPPALVETLAAWPGVAVVELDGQVPRPAPVTLAVTAPPTDNIANIGAKSLWDAGFSGLGVVVASFDSGVDARHPDLVTRWRGGSNSWFDPYTATPEPTDTDGHGTAVTSLMVGGAAMPANLGGNNIGVAPDAQWIAAKIFPAVGNADNSMIHRAFQWAINPDGNPAVRGVGEIGRLGRVGHRFTVADGEHCTRELAPQNVAAERQAYLLRK